MPAAPAEVLLVRLKPFNPRRGYVLKTYVDGPSGAVFKEERGWYEVPAALGEKLRDVTSKPENTDSPAAFDVCTKEEAVALERRIRRQQQERAIATDPNSVEGASRDHIGGRTPRSVPARDASTLTTADLPNGKPVINGDLDEDDADANDLNSTDLAADVAASASKPKGKAGKGAKSLLPGAPDDK